MGPKANLSRFQCFICPSQGQIESEMCVKFARFSGGSKGGRLGGLSPPLRKKSSPYLRFPYDLVIY